MNNYERIKTMTVDEMAEFLTKELCEDCGYTDNWQSCTQIGCWCHKNNGYQTYKQWLMSESEE